MCGCTGGSSSSGFGSGSWSVSSRLRYQVESNGFTVSYGSMADAERHRAAHGGVIKTLKPGQK